jgi:Rrf2 family transcriptional regulator, cysteine metabolism repressor
MKLLTKQTDYAARALIFLAQHRDEFVSSNAMARKNKIPLHFLRQVLQTLIKKGIITSQEGVDGGVKISAKPQNIYLSDLIGMFQGKIQLSKCMFRNRVCPNRNHCVLRKRVKTIEKKIVDEFKGISIQTLLNDLTH